MWRHEIYWYHREYNDEWTTLQWFSIVLTLICMYYWFDSFPPSTDRQQYTFTFTSLSVYNRATLCRDSFQEFFFFFILSFFLSNHSFFLCRSIELFALIWWLTSFFFFASVRIFVCVCLHMYVFCHFFSW